MGQYGGCIACNARPKGFHPNTGFFVYHWLGLFSVIYQIDKQFFLSALLDNANQILLKTVSFALHKRFRFLKSPLPGSRYRALQLYLFIEPPLWKNNKARTGGSKLYLLMIPMCLLVDRVYH